MRAHVRATASAATRGGRRGSSASSLDLGDDPRERPFGERDRSAACAEGASREHDVDTGRFILAVPCRREGIRRNTSRAGRVAPGRPKPRCDAPRPDNAEECSGSSMRRGMLAARTVSCPPGGTSAASQSAAAMAAGRIIEACKPRPHASRGSIAVHRPPGVRSAYRVPAPGADVEQIAGRERRPADERRNAGRRNRRCRYRRIKLERIDRRARAGEVARGLGLGGRRGQDQSTRARRNLRQRSRHRELSPLAPYRLRGRWPVRVYIRTPRPMRPRVTTAGGRSPGSRVLAVDHLPKNTRSQWHLWS